MEIHELGCKRAWKWVILFSCPMFVRKLTTGLYSSELWSVVSEKQGALSVKT